MLTKILITRPIFLFGTLSNKNEFRKILTPELETPKKIEIKNKEKRNLLLIIIKIDMLVSNISTIVNSILLICLNQL